MKDNFIELCLRGEATVDEIDSYMDEWYELDKCVTLNEFLGLSWEEYKIFGKKGRGFLKDLINEKKHGAKDRETHKFCPVINSNCRSDCMSLYYDKDNNRTVCTNQQVNSVILLNKRI